MEHPEDLYLLDAEQAVRELAVYLDGTADCQSHRIVATINYLATLLRTLGMDQLGLAGEQLVEALEQLDEGQARRLIREFTESTQDALDAARKGSPQLEGNERLDRLLERLSPFTPQTEGTQHFDWGPSEAKRDLLSHAYKAIQAADSFATILSCEARPSGFSGGHIPVAEAPETTAKRANIWQGSGWDVRATHGELAGSEDLAFSTQNEGARGWGHIHPLAPPEPIGSPELPKSPEPFKPPEPYKDPEPYKPLEPYKPSEPFDFDPIRSGGYSTHPEHAEPSEQLETRGHLEPSERGERFVRVVSPELRALKAVPTDVGRSKAVAPEAPGVLKVPRASMASGTPGPSNALPIESAPVEATGSEVAAPTPSAKATRRRRETTAASAATPTAASAATPTAASAATPTAASAAFAKPSPSAAGSLPTPGQIAKARYRSTPGEPNRQATPAYPATPTTPTNPTNPPPTNPATPANLTNPTNHANLTNPTNHADLTNPTNHANLTNPTNHADPVDPVGSVDPPNLAATTQPAAAALSESPGSGSAPQASAPGSLAVDVAFRAALRLADESAWMRGLATLLESIDTLDHQPLAEAFPSQLTLLRGSELRCHNELLRALASAFATLPCSGVAEASLAGTTLALVVELERAIAATPLARLVAHFHGRIEVDPGRHRWQILVPSSARLLRVVPLRLEEHWIAVSWAQYLGLDIATQREAQLRLGEQTERLRVVEAGAVVVGVRFDLDPAVRRRERYRGLVLTPASQWLPTYA